MRPPSKLAQKLTSNFYGIKVQNQNSKPFLAMTFSQLSKFPTTLSSQKPLFSPNTNHYITPLSKPSLNIPISPRKLTKKHKNPIFMKSKDQSNNFQDFLPLMAEKLGGDGLIGELCNGFRLLMDSDKGVITFESLKKNSSLLGLDGFSDEDLFGMFKEGDFDGDGALNQMKFCVLMFRLSPDLMGQSEFLLEEALEQ